MIDFYFDIGSPYSYLCATQIDGVAAKHGHKVSWRPFLLGAVFKASGNEMPARIPTKAKWMLGDLSHWAEVYQVPFHFPAIFPANSLRAMRACCFAETKGRLRELAMSLFSAYWTRGVDPSSDAGLRQAAASSGLDGAQLIEAIDTQAIKDKLRANTETAIAAGAFGAPTMIFDGQLLWGNDRLVVLDHLLAKSSSP
jgi:2-hydroxychromene-2-carboxylate isomerase